MRLRARVRLRLGLRLRERVRVRARGLRASRCVRVWGRVWVGGMGLRP